MGIRSSTMKVLLISSLLLAVATADSCLMRVLSRKRPFWLEVSALAQRTWPSARQTCPTQSWVRSRQQSARATPPSSAPPPWTVSSGRDFPCWLLLEMIPASHRLVMPPWKALAQRENSGFSEREWTDFNKFLVDTRFYFVIKQS